MLFRSNLHDPAVRLTAIDTAKPIAGVLNQNYPNVLQTLVTAQMEGAHVIFSEAGLAHLPKDYYDGKIFDLSHWTDALRASFSNTLLKAKGKKATEEQLAAAKFGFLSSVDFSNVKKATYFTGSKLDDRVVGSRSDDILVGNEGNDILNGGLGNDKIWGGKGNDTIRTDFTAEGANGKSNDDILSGMFKGEGASDTFVFKVNQLKNISLERGDFDGNNDIDLRIGDENGNTATIYDIETDIYNPIPQKYSDHEMFDFSLNGDSYKFTYDQMHDISTDYTKNLGSDPSKNQIDESNVSSSYKSAAIQFSYNYDGRNNVLLSPFKNDHANLIVGDFNGDNADDFIYQIKLDVWRVHDEHIKIFYSSSSNSKYYTHTGYDMTSKVRGVSAESLVAKNAKFTAIDLSGDGQDDLIVQAPMVDRWVRDYSAKTYISNGNGFEGGGELSSYIYQGSGNKFYGKDTNIIRGDLPDGTRDYFITQHKQNTAKFYNYYSQAEIVDDKGNKSAVNNKYIGKDATDIFKGVTNFSTDTTTILTGDFNGDGRDDVLLQVRSDDSEKGLHVYLMNDPKHDGFKDKMFTKAASYNVMANISENDKLYVADINGDGRDDIVALPPKGNSYSVSNAKVHYAHWFGFADGKAMPSGLSSTTTFLDYDGDGDSDWFAQHGNSNVGGAYFHILEDA